MIGNDEIRFEFKAGTSLFEFRIGNGDVTAASSGTLLVGNVKDVRLTADVAHVHLDAPVQLHPPVGGAVDRDDFVVGTAASKRFALTVILSHCRR